jgi:thiol-disulfide isomerase/thioredoxin
MSKSPKKTKNLIEGPSVLIFPFLLMVLIFGFFILRAYFLGYVGTQKSIVLSDESKKIISLNQTLFYKNRLVQVKDLLTKEKTLFIFWATWCDPCIDEIKAMPSKLKALEAKGYELIFINYDAAENKDKAHKFISSFGLDTAFDPTGQILAEIGISALPASFVVDKSGKISKILLGVLDEKEL